MTGGGCLRNIDEVITLVNKIRQDSMKNASGGKKPKEYLFFLDLKKAFDSIDRSLLIEKMIKKKVHTSLIRATRELYQGMSLKVGKEEVTTNIGVVQGGVTSPLLFNFYIDEMVVAMNKFGTCLALADDIIIHVKGDLQLNLMINALKKLCQDLKLTISLKKSAVMEIKKKKQRTHKRKLIYGFPAATSYKYLGICIQDNLKF